ncbi:unnamed protein product [Haemonchus placei]|uniref:Uncharacterized protein n=1 Tax=Haemonchus placei TaxID=6290 RepID=A0A158QKS8_HAEPC|nr:unnamed protein product [Haemonchus placei]
MSAGHYHSLGPSVSARASRFDTSVRDGGSKYRNEARELLNKWTSRERNNGYYSYRFTPRKIYADSSSTSKPMENAAANGYLNKTNEYPHLARSDHGANDSPNRREFARRSATTIDHVTDLQIAQPTALVQGRPPHTLLRLHYPIAEQKPTNQRK